MLQFRGVRGASVSRFATRESRSLFAVRDGIDHLLQLRLNLPGLHETLAVLPEPLVNLQSLLAHFLQERVPGRVRGEGRVRGGAEEDVLGIRRERRARATRRCDRGRAGGIAASRRTTRAGRNARFDPEKADGKRRVPRVDAWSSPQKSIRFAAFFRGSWWEPGMIAMGEPTRGSPTP